MVKSVDSGLDAIFAALAHPIRRRIVERLHQQDTGVATLASEFHVSPPAISRHLRVLENAGLLRRTQSGRTRTCHLVMQPLRNIDQWIARHHAFWSQQLDSLEHALETTEKTP